MRSTMPRAFGCATTRSRSTSCLAGCRRSGERAIIACTRLYACPADEFRRRTELGDARDKFPWPQPLHRAALLWSNPDEVKRVGQGKSLRPCKLICRPQTQVTLDRGRSANGFHAETEAAG